MKSLFIIIVVAITMLSCSSESQEPKAGFKFQANDSISIEARKLLHEIAVQNNYSFNDRSNIFEEPHRSTLATATRIDGMMIILSGLDAASRESLSILIYCAGKCSDWEKEHEALKKIYGGKWKLMSQ